MMNTQNLLIILFLIITGINLTIIPETKIFNNNNITIHNLTKSKYYFHIEISQELGEINLPNYIKIFVNQDEKRLFENKYIISFFQGDSTFKKIKPILNGFSASYIWLNKEQIKSGFYFSVEDIYQNCKYQIQIIPKDYIELTFESYTYSYYIYQENKISQFLIKGENYINPELDDKLIFYAYGNNNSTVEFNLNISDYRKHSKYNAYILKNLQYEDYIITVEGEIGDILDVGVLFLNTYDSCKHCKHKNEALFYGFLKRDYLNEICCVNLIMPRVIKVLDNLNINEEQLTRYGNAGCLNILNPELKEYDELFFSYYILYEFSQPSNENKNKNISESLYLQTGFYFYQRIKENQIVKYLPLRLENNFEFVKYYIKFDRTYLHTYKTEAKVYLSIQINNEEKKIPLKENFGIYTYTLMKDEIKEILNQSDKWKIMLYFECLKGGYVYDISFCAFHIALYIDKTKFNNTLYKNYGIIRNKESHKFNLELNNFLVEKLSGDICIFTNHNYSKYYNYNNKYYLYEYEFNDIENKNNYNINIIAKKNSIYRIQYLNSKESQFLNVGENYFLQLKKGIKYTFSFMNKILYKDYHDGIYGVSAFIISHNEVPDEKIYFNYYPINCKLEINEDNTNSLYWKEIKIPNSNNNRIFYQNILFVNKNYFSYNIYPKNIINNNDICLLYISSYNMNISEFYQEESIILKENQSQFVAFNKNIQSLNFTYYFAEIKDDIRIKINLYNKADFILFIYIGNTSNKFIYEIQTNKIIDIKGNDLYNFCVQENQICRIYFTMNEINKYNNMKFKDDENDYIVEINIMNTSNTNQIIKKSKISYTFIIIFFICLFIIIGYLFCKKIKKKKIKINTKDKGTELIDID